MTDPIEFASPSGGIMPYMGMLFLRSIGESNRAQQYSNRAESNKDNVVVLWMVALI